MNHLDFIRGLPCLICLDNTSTEAAHVRMADNRAAKPITGVGRKPPDMWTVPLCGRHHRMQHAGGEAKFWDRKMIDPDEELGKLDGRSGKEAEEAGKARREINNAEGISRQRISIVKGRDGVQRGRVELVHHFRQSNFEEA